MIILYWPPVRNEYRVLTVVNHLPMPRMIIKLKFLLSDLNIEPLSFIQSKNLRSD